MAPSYLPDPKRYERAHFRRCGRSGIVLPPISLGLWQNFGGVDVFETGRAMLRRAFDRGVTHIDLANNYGPPYGSAEENFGQFVDRHTNEELGAFLGLHLLAQDDPTWVPPPARSHAPVGVE